MQTYRGIAGCPEYKPGEISGVRPGRPDHEGELLMPTRREKLVNICWNIFFFAVLAGIFKIAFMSVACDRDPVGQSPESERRWIPTDGVDPRLKQIPDDYDFNVDSAQRKEG